MAHRAVVPRRGEDGCSLATGPKRQRAKGWGPVVGCTRVLTGLVHGGPGKWAYMLVVEHRGRCMGLGYAVVTARVGPRDRGGREVLSLARLMAHGGGE
ncbi:hypothetical protein E2562_037791 [Oryza meyeriana var. granulata]|uniref:Uncharacterized protein n=1 Tax=Oryza meyeriana var. granulata TaxID=110450 RepID=A0A6G1EAH2_9ORYZ|nr:hypothetical protein E2562_037791 [Oryza meyeriana var. granulata]